MCSEAPCSRGFRRYRLAHRRFLAARRICRRDRRSEWLGWRSDLVDAKGESGSARLAMLDGDPGIVHQTVEILDRPRRTGALGKRGSHLRQWGANLPEAILEAVGAGMLEHDVATQHRVPCAGWQEWLKRCLKRRRWDERPERPTHPRSVVHEHNTVAALETSSDPSPAVSVDLADTSGRHIELATESRKRDPFRMRRTTRLENPQIPLGERQEARPRMLKPAIDLDQLLDRDRGETAPSVSQPVARGFVVLGHVDGKCDGFPYVLRTLRIRRPAEQLEPEPRLATRVPAPAARRPCAGLR